MADESKLTPPNYMIDQDSTDDFLDLPVSRYAPDGKTIAEMDADREAAGLPPIVVKEVPLPPITDH